MQLLLIHGVVIITIPITIVNLTNNNNNNNNTASLTDTQMVLGVPSESAAFLFAVAGDVEAVALEVFKVAMVVRFPSAAFAL